MGKSMGHRMTMEGGEEEVFRLLWRLGILTAPQTAVLYREGEGCGVRWAQRVLSSLDGKGIASGERRSLRWRGALRGPRSLCYSLTDDGVTRAGRLFDDLASVAASKTYRQAYRPGHFDHAMLRNEYIALVAGDVRKAGAGIPQGLALQDVCAEPLAWRAAYPRVRKQKKGICRPDGAFWICSKDDPHFDRWLVLVEAHTGSQDTRAIMSRKIERYCSSSGIISGYVRGSAGPDPRPRIVFVCPDQNTAIRARRLANGAVSRTAYSWFADLAREKHAREHVADLFLFASLDELRTSGSLSAAYAPLDDTESLLSLL